MWSLGPPMPVNIHSSACVSYSQTKALMVGGSGEVSTTDRVYIYDHAEQSFTHIAFMASPAKNIRCVRHTLLDSRNVILCTAGRVAVNNWSRYTYIFDISDESWEQLDSTWNLPASVGDEEWERLIVANGRVMYCVEAKKIKLFKYLDPFFVTNFI